MPTSGLKVTDEEFYHNLVRSLTSNILWGREVYLHPKSLDRLKSLADKTPYPQVGLTGSSRYDY